MFKSMMLPFLQDHKWPMSKEPEERVVNPSSDKVLQDHMIGEIFSAMEHKDHKRLREALMSLVQCIHDEESNAADEG